MANFILRQVNDALWQRFKERAVSEGRSMRWVILELIEHYVKHGIPKKRD